MSEFESRFGYVTPPTSPDPESSFMAQLDWDEAKASAKAKAKAKVEVGLRRRESATFGVGLGICMPGASSRTEPPLASRGAASRPELPEGSTRERTMRPPPIRTTSFTSSRKPTGLRPLSLCLRRSSAPVFSDTFPPTPTLSDSQPTSPATVSPHSRLSSPLPSPFVPDDRQQAILDFFAPAPTSPDHPAPRALDTAWCTLLLSPKPFITCIRVGPSVEISRPKLESLHAFFVGLLRRYEAYEQAGAARRGGNPYVTRIAEAGREAHQYVCDLEELILTLATLEESTSATVALLRLRPIAEHAGWLADHMEEQVPTWVEEVKLLLRTLHQDSLRR